VVSVARTNRYAAATAGIAGGVAVCACGRKLGSQGGERCVVASCALRSMEDWKRSHHHFRVLKAVAKPL